MTDRAQEGQRKVSVYLDRELDARMRAALLHTMAAEGHRSLSEFVARALLYEVTRLEARYNGSAPFVLPGLGELPRGRPLRG